MNNTQLEILFPDIEMWTYVTDDRNYLVSTEGRVYSLKSKRLLKLSINQSGYMQVNAGRCRLVHRLVAEAFIPRDNKLLEVNHKDENKLNNNVDNLEWVTHRYNIMYGTRIFRFIQSKTGMKYNKK